MHPKTPKLLDDIGQAAAFIREVTGGRTIDEYRVDRLFRSAVERNFEIIGEAVNRLARVDPAIASRIGEYARIIAFRNVLIHGYDLIEDGQVWNVVQQELPLLHDTITALLREVNPAP